MKLFINIINNIPIFLKMRNHYLGFLTGVREKALYDNGGGWKMAHLLPTNGKTHRKGLSTVNSAGPERAESELMVYMQILVSTKILSAAINIVPTPVY
jgi:hypothetical protein